MHASKPCPMVVFVAKRTVPQRETVCRGTQTNPRTSFPDPFRSSASWAQREANRGTVTCCAFQKQERGSSSMDRVHHGESNATQPATNVASGNSGKRVSRRHDRTALQHSRGPSLAARTQTSDALEIAEGDCLCDECRGDPAQYRIDFEVDCPHCRGVGTVPDPDYYDAHGTFDPYREFSTMPRLRGRGRNQL